MKEKGQFTKLFSKDNLTLSQKMQEISDTILPILSTSIPTSFFFLSLFLQQAINISFISKTYNNYKMVDAIGLSHLYINCTTLCVTTGLVAGLDVLGSGAYSRGNNYLLGLYINRARILGYGFMIFMTIFNYFFGMRMLSIFSIDPEILEYCSQYLYKNMFMLIMEVTFKINIRILSILRKSMTNMKTLIVTICLHPLWCYLFIVKLDLGVSGAAYALILTQFLNAFSSTFYIIYFDPAPGSNFLPNAECFSGLIEYLKVALPITGITISDWMGYEIQSFIVIKIGELDYSVHIIVLSFEILIFTYSLGYNIAIATKVSALIVEETYSLNEHIEKCIKTINIFLHFGLASMVLIVTVIYMFKDLIVSLYTNDPLVHSMTTNCIGVICIYLVFGNMKWVLIGTFRGLTYLNIPSMIQFIVTYVIQTSLSAFIGLYLNMGIRGVWIGMTISLFILDSCYAFCYYNFDFIKFRDLSIERTKRQKKDVVEIIESDEIALRMKDSRSVSLVSSSYDNFR
jgi:MATE family multidrug resistance protein